MAVNRNLFFIFYILLRNAEKRQKQKQEKGKNVIAFNHLQGCKIFFSKYFYLPFKSQNR